MGNGAEKDNLSRIIKVLEEVKEGAFCSACVTEEMNIIEAAKLDSLELVNFLLLMEEEFEVEIDFDFFELDFLETFGSLSKYIEELKAGEHGE